MVCLFASKEHPVHQPTVSRNMNATRPYRICKSSDGPHSIPVAAPEACRDRMRKIPTDTWYTEGSSLRSSKPSSQPTVTIQPNTDTLWMEIGMNCSRGAELRAVWPVISPEFWLLTLHIGSWAVLQWLALWLELWENQGRGWSWISPCGVRVCGKTLRFACKNLRQSSLLPTSQLIRCWQPLAIRNLMLQPGYEL